MKVSMVLFLFAVTSCCYIIGDILTEAAVPSKKLEGLRPIIANKEIDTYDRKVKRSLSKPALLSDEGHNEMIQYREKRRIRHLSSILMFVLCSNCCKRKDFKCLERYGCMNQECGQK